MTQTVRIVLQARMGSLRRPGKTLASIAGKTLLARCLERLHAVRCGRGRQRPQLIVATSQAASDDAVEREAALLGYGCVRGSEENVLARYLAATADLDANDILVRATADNPLYCPNLTAQLIDGHRAGADVYTGIMPELSAIVPEVLRVGALRAMALRDDLDDYCREHVTPYFRREATPFRVQWLPNVWVGLDPSLRLTVDTQADVDHMDNVYRELIARTGGDDAPSWRLDQIYAAARTIVERGAWQLAS
ncbi:MAG: NTP transferase domain-containing protein [Planctomycetia bacterium]|nr:NTP transferase domain-containing protein [Planctomycetia bacterium]